MVKLLVKSDYQSRFKDKQIGFGHGEIIEVSEDLADFLGRDAPENFEKAPDRPAKDKQVSKPKKKKAAKKKPAKKKAAKKKKK